jgi:hypothetical protein
MRTRGSVRFAPYYKLEVWDRIRLAWRPVQKAHPTEEGARAAAPFGREARVYEVTEHGRRLLP